MITVAVFTILLLAACGSTDPEPRDLTGIWTGTTTTDEGTLDWRLTLADTGGGVLAGGVIIRDPDSGDSLAGTITQGSHEHPAVTMTMLLTVRGLVWNGTYEGTVGDSRESMAGTVRVEHAGMPVTTGPLALTRVEGT